MTEFIEGENRKQATLLPERLDDYIAENSHVRVVDVFIDEMDLKSLGFKTIPENTGRPGYHPATLLKLYIYGYLNRIQSSRRLEREAQRNVELMWLTGRLAPDFKTIADFRRDNGKAIQKVCREFVLICRKLNLFSDAFVAIDGSKFKAVNNRDRNYTRAKLKSRLKQIDESIARYLSQIASADRQDKATSQQTSERLEGKISKLKEEINRLKAVEQEVLNTADQQISLTDPDARSMATSGRGSGMVGYNVQSAVDTKHHLIVTHEVTNVGHDRAALNLMAVKAKQTLDVGALDVVADRGYYSGTEIYHCEQAKITTYLPKIRTSSNTKKGMFTKYDFKWIAQDDEYECPAGERLIYRYTKTENGKKNRQYWSSHCPVCSIKEKCTININRRISRWEDEDVLDKVQDRLEREPERMKTRRETAEHPFGTIKSWMGYTHFQMKTLKHVSTEMSLHVLAYNLKRAMSILGTNKLIEAMQA